MNLKSYDYLLQQIKKFNISNGCKLGFYLQVVLTEIKNGEVNERAMKVYHVLVMVCECWKGIIHIFLVHFYFAFYVASAILMLELQRMQCFNKLTCS